MPRENSLPTILEQAITADGVAFQLRKDSMGILEVPGFENVIVCAHVGPPAKLACRRDGRNYRGTAAHGDIDIIPANTPSQWEMQDQNDLTLLVSLPQSMLRTVASQSGFDAPRMEVRNRFQIRDAGLEALCWAVKREMEMGYQSGRLYLDGLALAAASRVVTRHSSVAKPAKERGDSLSGRRLKLVLSFIEEQLSEDLSLEQIASVAAVSASHLNTLFRNAMGMPVHRYLVQRRVERAKTLMLDDGLSMTEIALAAGFSHQSHMARHIRRALGVSPRAMKRLLAESSPQPR